MSDKEKLLKNYCKNRKLNFVDYNEDSKWIDCKFDIAFDNCIIEGLENKLKENVINLLYGQIDDEFNKAKERNNLDTISKMTLFDGKILIQGD